MRPCTSISKVIGGSLFTYFYFVRGIRILSFPTSLLREHSVTTVHPQLIHDPSIHFVSPCSYVLKRNG